MQCKKKREKNLIVNVVSADWDMAREASPGFDFCKVVHSVMKQ